MGKSQAYEVGILSGKEVCVGPNVHIQLENSDMFSVIAQNEGAGCKR